MNKSLHKLALAASFSAITGAVQAGQSPEYVCTTYGNTAHIHKRLGQSDVYTPVFQSGPLEKYPTFAEKWAKTDFSNNSFIKNASILFKEGEPRPLSSGKKGEYSAGASKYVPNVKNPVSLYDTPFIATITDVTSDGFPVRGTCSVAFDGSTIKAPIITGEALEKITIQTPSGLTLANY